MVPSENSARRLRGELHYAFTPELVEARRRCAAAQNRYNKSDDLSRRKRAELWNDVLGDTTPLPPVAATEEEDEELFAEYPWVDPPVRIDYGTNVKLGDNVYINSNCVIIDSCDVTIGSRTLFGPGVQLYAGGHPLDPDLRDGTKGPEFGTPIHIGEDCWIGGNSIILPGVTVGKGSVVGAGSVVTKDVAPYTVVVGNPARKLRDVPRNTKIEQASRDALAAVQRDQNQAAAKQ